MVQQRCIDRGTGTYLGDLFLRFKQFPPGDEVPLGFQLRQTLIHLHMTMLILFATTAPAAVISSWFHMYLLLRSNFYSCIVLASTAKVKSNLHATTPSFSANETNTLHWLAYIVMVGQNFMKGHPSR